MRLEGSDLLIGYTTDNGAYLLQVNSQIFATNATIATSDLTRKNVFASTADYTFKGQRVSTRISEKMLDAIFDIPMILYERTDEKRPLTSFGYGAQHFAEALAHSGITPNANGFRAVQTFNDGTLGLTDSDVMALKLAAAERRIRILEGKVAT